jgi:hypothetical protein
MKILDLVLSFRGASKEELWGADPVHPLEHDYKLLAASAISMAAGLTAANRRGGGGKKK